MILFIRLFTGCLLQLIPFAVLCLYPFKNNYRYSNKKTFCASTIFIVAIAFIFSCLGLIMRKFIIPKNMFNIVNCLFMCSLVFCLLWYHFITVSIWQKKVFIFSFTINTAMMITSASNTLCDTLLSHLYTTDGLPYQIITLPVLFIFTVVTLPVLFLIIKKGFLPVSDYLSKKEYISLSILSLILFLMLCLCYYPIQNWYLGQSISAFLYCAILVFVLTIYYVVFHMFTLSKKRMEIEKMLSYSEKMLHIQAEQYSQLMNQINEARRLRHDLRHHLIAIQGYADSGELESLKAYLKDNLTQTNELAITKYCDNETINILLSHYMSLANECHIKITPLINCPADIFINTQELMVLIGNLLENAYYGAKCAAISNRFINLNILFKGNILVITIDNGFDGHVKMNGTKYISTKTGHIGLGLESIQSIVNFYNGTVTFSHDKTQFHGNIILKKR